MEESLPKLVAVDYGRPKDWSSVQNNWSNLEQLQNISENSFSPFFSATSL